MTLKERLESIFCNDYPGTEIFVNEVIKPIFGDEIEPVNIDLVEIPRYTERARKAGLKHIKYIGDLTEQNYNADNIVLLDVTVDDSVNIERSRVNIQQLVRSIVQQFQHMLIVFHYENAVDTPWRFSYAYKAGSIADSTPPKRYTYVFGKDYRGRTAAERFEILAKSQRNNYDFAEAFSVRALSDEFFYMYRAYYATFVEYITGKRYSKEDKLNNIIDRFSWKTSDYSNQFSTVFNSRGVEVRDYVKKMFGRIIFLYFLQRKGWLYDNDKNSDPRYMYNLFHSSLNKDTFLDDVLELLFFYVLNTKENERIEAARRDDKDITILPGWHHIPYLNGGLFNPDDIDSKKCMFPAVYFKEFFEFLDSYNFTIDENDQEDAEIGIDPEMLGRIFENLLEDNKDKGAFYTPREIVEYMCRESIIAYLQKDETDDIVNNTIREFVLSQNIDLLSDSQRNFIESQLIKVKICDPAIGSGAFPMGMINLLSKLFITLRTYASIDQARMKRYIMQNNIYGVDIEQGAVDIARLRFWLAMVVDEPSPQTLPNLHFKIMQGNSLLESYNGRDLTNICFGYDNKGQASFDIDGHRHMLRKDIARFYGTDSHDERNNILTRIKQQVICQIFEETQDENFLHNVKDVTANERFFLWHTWFADVFENGGFDIVIGNPPYLLEGKVHKSIFEAVKHSPYYLGKMNIWYMFACQGLDMLKHNGNLCFIATNNWVTSAGAKKLRNKIASDAQILQICDFKDFMIFDTASIQTMIMQFKKSHTLSEYTFDLRNLLGTKLEDVNKMLNKDADAAAEYINPIYSRLRMRDRFLTFSASDDLLNKMTNTSGVIYLENKEIAQGIVFPQDFLNKDGQQALAHHNVGDGIFGLSFHELENLHLSDEEMALIKPYYTTEQVKRYFTPVGANQRWLIYTDSSYKEETSMDNYPRLKKHLDQFKDIFTSANKPYGLHRARDSRFFSGQKVVCQRKCPNMPIFSYSEGECYLSQTFNIIKTERANKKYLTGLLNSRLIAFWLRNRGKMQGANYQLDKEPIQQIPIAVPTESIQGNVADIVSNIIIEKTSGANIDTTNYESLIDHIVYHLYGLTYDEVLIVDPETPILREEYENFKID